MSEDKWISHYKKMVNGQLPYKEYYVISDNLNIQKGSGDLTLISPTKAGIDRAKSQVVLDRESTGVNPKISSSVIFKRKYKKKRLSKKNKTIKMKRKKKKISTKKSKKSKIKKKMKKTILKNKIKLKKRIKKPYMK